MKDLTPGTPPERTEITLAYPAADLLAQFNIEAAEVPAKVLLDFSENVKNRENPINIKIVPTCNISVAGWGEAGELSNMINTNQSVLNAHQDIDTYPFREVIDMIVKEDQK